MFSCADEQHLEWDASTVLYCLRLRSLAQCMFSNVEYCIGPVTFKKEAIADGSSSVCGGKSEGMHRFNVLNVGALRESGTSSFSKFLNFGFPG